MSFTQKILSSENDDYYAVIYNLYAAKDYATMVEKLKHMTAKEMVGFLDWWTATGYSDAKGLIDILKKYFESN